MENENILGPFYLRVPSIIPGIDTPSYMHFDGQTKEQLEANLHGRSFEYITQEEYDAALAALEAEREKRRAGAV